MTTGAAIEAYKLWQELLAKHGDTHVATDAFFRLAAEIESDPFLDVRGFEATLERLHRAAFPQASTRPPRLSAGDLVHPRE
jgi:hypothetical protein